MITPKDLARVKPGLRDEDNLLREFLAQKYDHATQMRKADGDAQWGIFSSSTFYDGERS